jgi:AraC-like DNA-binding protein
MGLLVRNRALSGYAIVLVEQGRGFFFSRPSGRLPVQAGSVLWLFPGVAHSYGPEPVWHERWMLFTGPLAERLGEQGYLDAGNPVHQIGHDSETLSAFDRSWRAYQSGGQYAMALATAALIEFIIRSAEAQSNKSEQRRRLDHIVGNAMRIIDEEALVGCSPSDIAKRLKVPYSTLRRRFVKATGFSPRDYAIAVRLKRAKELLVSDERPIADVARSCGFEDAFYFARLFADRVGMTPTQFRRTGRL